MRNILDLVDKLQTDKKNFQELSALLKKAVGINLPLSDKNLSLVAGRLQKILLKNGMTSYDEYLPMLRKGDPNAMSEFISALTTNTTHFFRENAHFKILSELVPKIVERNRRSGKNEVRVWCAAASTGEEPFTIAMTLLEAFGSEAFINLKMLATDVDHRVIESAQDAVYREETCEAIPPIYKQKYFERLERNGQIYYRANEKLRSCVQFATFNLLTPTYPFKNGFDVIFCRNVLIYFENAMVHEVTSKIFNCLNPEGYLFLGHSEASAMRDIRSQVMGNAVFQSVASKKRAA